MTSITINSGNIETPIRVGLVSGAITRLIEFWQQRKRNGNLPVRETRFIEQHLLDKNLGPEIARCLR